MLEMVSGTWMVLFEDRIHSVLPHPPRDTCSDTGYVHRRHSSTPMHSHGLPCVRDAGDIREQAKGRVLTPHILSGPCRMGSLVRSDLPPLSPPLASSPAHVFRGHCV